MKRTTPLTIVLACALAGALTAWNAHGATNALFANGVDWSTNYYNPDITVNVGDYDKLPTGANTTPIWTPGSYAAPGWELTNNALRINTSTNGAALSFRQTNNWDATRDTTIEFRLRVVEQDSTAWAGSVLFANGAKWQTFYVTTNSVKLAAASPIAGDFTQWTVFRITLENMTSSPTAKLYINNQTNVYSTSTTFNSAAINYLQFGDGSTGASESGIVEWDYIRWTSAGAFPVTLPIPEPMVVTLLALGGFLIFRRPKRR